MDVGQNILRERLKQRVTQVELALRSGVSQPNLSAIEKNRRDMTVSTLRQIALALNVQPGILLGETPVSPVLQTLTRPRIERIARLVVNPGIPSPNTDGRIASLFRQILPASGSKRRPAKKTLRSWLELRAQFDQTQIHSVLARIQDQTLRAA